MTLLSMIECFCRSIYDISVTQIEEAAHIVTDTIRKNNSIFICGNGGSGSNANLFASSVIRLIKNNGLSVRVISLNANMSLITAVAESEGYDRVFSWQIENMASGSDMLIAISGSGNSPNILEAVASAKKLGMYTIGLTGMGGGRMASMVDIPIIVNSDNMEQIESVHTSIIHAIAIWAAESLNDMKKPYIKINNFIP